MDSGHHTVLLAGLKVCGSLSGFEEEQLCEKRWKHHMVNLMARVLKEQGSSVPSMQNWPWQLYCTKYCRPLPIGDRGVSQGLVWLCTQVHKKDEERETTSAYVSIVESTTLGSKRSKLPPRMMSLVRALAFLSLKKALGHVGIDFPFLAHNSYHSPAFRAGWNLAANYLHPTQLLFWKRIFSLKKSVTNVKSH